MQKCCSKMRISMFYCNSRNFDSWNDIEDITQFRSCLETWNFDGFTFDFDLNCIWWALMRFTRSLASIRAFFALAARARFQLRSKSRWRYAKKFSSTSIVCECFIASGMSKNNNEIKRNDFKICFARWEFRWRCQYLRLRFFAMFVCSVMRLSAVTVESELLFVLFFWTACKTSSLSEICLHCCRIL